MTNEIQQFDELAGKIQVYVAPIKSLVVVDAASNAVAAGTLRTIKSMSDQIEARRVGMVKPLNDQVKMVNSRAKTITAPLEEAERFVKSLMAKFADEEKRQREAEQKRIEEEHRKEQDRLRKEAADRQKKLDDDAAKERKRLADEQIKADKEAQAKLKASKPSMFGSSSSAEKQAEKERQRKAKAEEDRKALELRQQEERATENARAERERLEQEKVAEQKRRSVEATRPKNTREVTKFAIDDLSLLPREYMIPDEKKISAAIIAGLAIPGVRVYKETVVVAR